MLHLHHHLIGDLQAEIGHVDLEGAAVDLVGRDLFVHRDLEHAEAHASFGERVLDEEVLALVVAFQHDHTGSGWEAQTSGKEKWYGAHGDWSFQSTRIRDLERYSERISTTVLREFDGSVPKAGHKVQWNLRTPAFTATSKWFSMGGMGHE